MRIIIVAGSKHHTFYQYQKQNNDFYIGIEDGAYEIIKHGYKLDVAIGDLILQHIMMKYVLKHQI